MDDDCNWYETNTDLTEIIKKQTITQRQIIYSQSWQQRALEKTERCVVEVLSVLKLQQQFRQQNPYNVALHWC